MSHAACSRTQIQIMKAAKACDVCRDVLMEEVNALHEKFENPRTRRTYCSGGKGFDVSASCWIGMFPKQPTIQSTEVTYKFEVAIQQEWAKKCIKDHDGVIKAEDVTKYMLLKFRKALNIHGKVSCKIINP